MIALVFDNKQYKTFDNMNNTKQYKTLTLTKYIPDANILRCKMLHLLPLSSLCCAFAVPAYQKPSKMINISL